MEKPRRNIYLRMKTREEACRIWTAATASLRSRVEDIESRFALHRVTAEPVVAAWSVPHYHGAAMDGIAVRAQDTYGAGDAHPVRLIHGKTAFPVDTGDPLPPETDAVIMIEQVEPISPGEVEIRAAAFPWQHVRKVGEDIVAGELLLPRQHRLRPADIGSLLASGVTETRVFARPRVWIQPTGSELIPARRGGETEPGRIIEFNGAILSGMVLECDGEPLLRDIVLDDYESIRRNIEEAVASDADIVLLNAGSSAGSEDYTTSVIESLGTVLVHGVTMMPGKPTVLGLIQGKPVVGIPGYPVSAILAFEQFVRPLLFSMQGLPCPDFQRVEATLGRKLPSRLGMEEFVRVILGRVQGRLVAMPLQRGAGVISSVIRADGMIQIPQEQEGLDIGEKLSVRLLRPREQLEDTLIMIGSHDNTIDVLSNELKRWDSRLHLSSSNVGSVGGLMALMRGQAHLAGSHLLETETGEYNYSYISRYLKGTPVRLVQLAKRQQGLLIRPGNPKGINGIEDLLHSDVTYINRQGGSGTRILLDYCLGKAGLSEGSIRGYEQEEFTHMAVAVAIHSGRADAGMAIYAAARALNLEFLPVAQERYDLVVPEACWEDRKIQVLMDIIVSGSFRRMVDSLGGYDVSGSGTLMGRWDGEEWR